MNFNHTEATTMTATKTYFQQATTGKLHATKNCSITSRTRYNHFELELTPEQVAQYPKCAKCFGATMPAAPARKTPKTPIEEAFPVGSRVRQTGYGVTFEVVGYWRGYAKLAYNGTTHSAPASELTPVDGNLETTVAEAAERMLQAAVEASNGVRASSEYLDLLDDVTHEYGVTVLGLEEGTEAFEAFALALDRAIEELTGLDVDRYVH